MKIRHLIPGLWMAAMAAGAATMHGTETLVIGSTTGATNLVRTAGFGDWALWGADTATLGLYAGQSAGAYGNGLYRCTALGFAAMAKATNCTDCIAIGPRVGQNWRNRTGWVQIGDAFAYTNNCLDIGKGMITGIPQGLFFNKEILSTVICKSDLHADGTIDAGTEVVTVGLEVLRDATVGSSLTLGDGDSVGAGVTLSWDGTNINVTAGGVLLGHLTITPPAAGNQ